MSVKNTRLSKVAKAEISKLATASINRLEDADIDSPKAHEKKVLTDRNMSHMIDGVRGVIAISEILKEKEIPRIVLFSQDLEELFSGNTFSPH